MGNRLQIIDIIVMTSFSQFEEVNVNKSSKATMVSHILILNIKP